MTLYFKVMKTPVYNDNILQGMKTSVYNDDIILQGYENARL